MQQSKIEILYVNKDLVVVELPTINGYVTFHWFGVNVNNEISKLHLLNLIEKIFVDY